MAIEFDKQDVTHEKEFCPSIILCGINTPNCATYLINKPIFVIGKSNDCDAVLSFSGEISQKHAQIVWKNGEYEIMDLNSANRTFLNGEILVANRSYPLHIDDIVKLSSFTFAIEKINL